MSKVMELINRKASREDTEDSVALRLFTYFSVALGIFVAGFYNELYAPMAVGLAGITAGYAFSYYRRGYTNWWSRIILTIAMMVSGYVYVRQMIFSGRDHMLILTELMIVMQVLHSFDLPRRKDLVYSVLSAFMLICIGGVMSRTLWYGAFLGVFIVLSLVMLALFHFQEAATGAKVNGRPRALVPMMFLTFGWLALGFPFFFILMPRYETHAFSGLPVSGRVQEAVRNFAGQVMYPEPPNKLGGTGDPIPLDDSTFVDSSSFGDAYFGFAPTLNLNARARFSDKLLMRVRTPTANYYRGLVFDRYTDKGWKMSDMKGKRIATRSGNSEIQLDKFKDNTVANPPFTSDVVYQTFYFENDMPNLVYAALEPTEIFFPIYEIVMDKNVSLRAAYILKAGTVYTAVSKAPRYQARYLRMHTDPCTKELSNYCSTDNIPPAVAEYARRVTSGAANNLDRLNMLSSAMARDTQYDLDAPRAPSGQDPVEFFLLKSRRGFCEHYASAFTLMARSLNMPSRLVTGFAPGNYNVFTGLFEITGEHAHAWTEVYFPYVGWVPFDPTPGGPSGPLEMQRTTPLTFILDEYANKAKIFLMAKAARLMAVLTPIGGWRVPAAAAALAILAIVLAFVLRAKHMAESAVAGLPPGNRIAITLYYDVLKKSRGKGLAVTPASVPSEIEAWFPDELRPGFRELAALFERAAYSPHEISAEESTRAADLHRELIRT